MNGNAEQIDWKAVIMFQGCDSMNYSLKQNSTQASRLWMQTTHFNLLLKSKMSSFQLSTERSQIETLSSKEDACRRQVQPYENYTQIDWNPH